MSPLLFIVILIPLSITLNGAGYGYLLLKETPINHLFLMDDLKLHGKTEHELKSLAPTVWIILKDIGIEFGMRKFVIWRI